MDLRASHFDLFYRMNIPDKDDRISWDDYFLLIAAVVSLRSTCNRRKYGSVIVRDNRIISTGYNGAPTGAPHCLGHECRRMKENIPHGERYDLCRAIHSEVNALSRVRNPFETYNAMIYIIGYDCETSSFIPGIPCQDCYRQCKEYGLYAYITKSEGLKGEIIKKFF